MSSMPLFRVARRFAAALAFVTLAAGAAAAQEPVKLGYAKCAHCTPLTLVPENAKGAKVEAIGFTTGNDVLTALVSKSIDVAQVTYLHYATALDRGFDVVAISGQVSGGSTLLAANDLPVDADDWTALKALIAKHKEDGKPFRVAASRGNAQDIHMRGAFAKQGIDVNKDVTFVNIPNPSDHIQALRRGEVEMICTVEPFGTQILQSKGAKLFTHPYDQPAGRLTNLMVTRSDMIASNPEGVQAVVGGVVAVNEKISADKGLWADVIVKVTGLDRKIAEGAIGNLYPDAPMHRPEAIAIAGMMRDLKYISKDVTAKVEANMDYSFLEAATGKPKTELGY